jgi:hypothetical protein
MDENARPAAAGETIVQGLVEETEMILTAKHTKRVGRAGSPLPGAPANANDGAHGLSRHSLATAEVTRPAEQQFHFVGFEYYAVSSILKCHDRT